MNGRSPQRTWAPKKMAWRTLLLGGAIIVLKNMSSSMGSMTSHIWKIKLFETTNQVIFFCRKTMSTDSSFQHAAYRCFTRLRTTHPVTLRAVTQVVGRTLETLGALGGVASENGWHPPWRITKTDTRLSR